MLYSFTFLVPDLDAVEAYAAGFGVGTVRQSGHTVVLDSEPHCGGVYAFTDRALPRATPSPGGPE